MKKLLLLLAVLSLSLTLSSCGSSLHNDFTRRVEVDSNYVEEISNSHGLVDIIMVHEDYYSSIDEMLLENNIVYDITDSKTGFTVVFGIDNENKMKALFIPEYVELEVYEIDIYFPTYEETMIKVNLFNLDETLPDIILADSDSNLYVGIESTNRINDDTVDKLETKPMNSMMLEIGKYISPDLGECNVYLVYLGNETYSLIANDMELGISGYQILLTWNYGNGQ